jgi:hypothetical protein
MVEPTRIRHPPLFLSAVRNGNLIGHAPGGRDRRASQRATVRWMVNAGMARFGRSPVVTSKGAALNYPSQPLGRALGRDIASRGTRVGPETTRVLEVAGRLRVPCDHPPGISLGAASEAISSPAVPVFPRADFPPLLRHHGVGQSFTAHGDCGLPLLSR